MAATLRRIVKSSPALMRVAAPLFRIKSIALAHVPQTGRFPQFSGITHLDSVSFTSFPQFDEWRTENAGQIRAWELEDQAAAVTGKFAFTTPGYCAICEAAVDFLTTTEYSKTDSDGTVIPNWREHLICPRCHLRNRMRAASHIAIQDFDMSPEAEIYITEQFGNGYRWLRGHFKHVRGSEFLSPKKASGSRMFGISHEDVQALSLATASLDYVLTFDVLEHVPNYRAAYCSFARVLRPGGKLIMTVPFTIDKFETTVRAQMDDNGQIEHLMPIELHGNPTDPANGSLCYRHFGWDTLQELTDVGFTDARVHTYHSRHLGYMGSGQSVISAIKA